MRLARILLVVAAVPVAAWWCLLGLRWVDRNYVPLPAEGPAPVGGMHNLGYVHTVQAALERFADLPAPVQGSLLENLHREVQPLQEWLASLDEARYQVICLGESHTEETRAFLAEQIFPALRIDTLLLEATEAGARAIARKVERHGETVPRVPLLGADIGAVVSAVHVVNPEARIVGIEETATQHARRRRLTPNSLRDRSLYANFWRHFRPGRRHVILIGALHCTGEEGWLFERLATDGPRGLRRKVLNVRVMSEHQSGPVESLVRLLDAFGFPRRDFVVRDIASLAPALLEWLRLSQSISVWGSKTLVVYREPRAGGASEVSGRASPSTRSGPERRSGRPLSYAARAGAPSGVEAARRTPAKRPRPARARSPPP